MNFNNNNNELINFLSNSNNYNHYQWYPISSNQSFTRQKLQHSQELQVYKRKKKKSHGNRKLQRYRRKLRQRAMNLNVITTGSTPAWVDTISSSELTQQDPKITIPFANGVVFNSQTTISIKDEIRTDIHNSGRDFNTSFPTNNKLNIIEQQKKIVQTKENLNRSVHMNQVTSSTTTDDSPDFTNIPDQIFYQILSTAFHGSTDKFNNFLNENEKIEFVRHYTHLIGRLNYLQLQQQQQWDYYHYIGMTDHIWTGRIPKHLAKKNSICYTYGRSKTCIEQHRKKFQEQLQQAQNAIQLFEQQIPFKSATQHVDYSAEMKILSSIIHTFVYQNQQKLQNEFEYKREMLIMDATDHRLVQTFFDLKPNKSQIISARRMWQVTAKQMIINEQLAILEHRLTSKQLPPASTLLDRILDNIDANLAQQKHTVEQNSSSSTTTLSSNSFEQMQKFKYDIIQQNVITCRETAASFEKIILNEKEKYSLNIKDDEYQSKRILIVANAIKARRLHMVRRATYITKYKLSSYFNENQANTT